MIEEPMVESTHVSRVFRSSFPRAEDTGFRTLAWRDGVARSAAELAPLYPTMLHAFAHAAKQDDRTGITLLADDAAAGELHRSYRRLYHEARAMAGALVARGVRPGAAVLLVLPTSFEFVTALFAIQLIGAIPVPSYPPAVLARAPQAIDRLRQVAASSAASLCITDRRLRPLLGELLAGGTVRDIVIVEALVGGDPERLGRVRAAAADPGFVQYTSGSTNRPKGVLLTHGNLCANIHAIGQASHIQRNDSGVVWLPLYHDMGLIGGLLFCVYWRIPLALMSPMAFLADPLRWLRVISRRRATLSPAPNFAYALCAKRAATQPIDDLDLSTWRIAFNGAEPVNPATIDAFVARFAPRGFRAEAMLPVYGLAEVSLAAAFPQAGAPPSYETVDRAELAAGRAVAARGPGAVSLTSVGRSVPGHGITVVDEHGAELPEREVGHILVSGPSVMVGYYRDAEATTAVLDGDTLWTGDLGFISGGNLFVAGRAKDLIIVHGRNYYAEDLERVVTGVAGVRPGGVVAFGAYDETDAADRVVLVCETRLAGVDERVALVERIGATVSDACGLPVDEVVLARPGTIPKTPSGKIQRGLCRDLYLCGDLGRHRRGVLEMVKVFARSSAGFLTATTRRLLGRPPE
jgi:acyl-CoA synthetase (AMP-forming)/AMP-acid ligase II